MAKYAPVAPIIILSGLQEVDLLGDYNLLLAHDVLDNVDRYKEVFNSKKEHRDCFIIMDNSTVELGRPVPPDLLYKAAKIVNASVVCLPDILYDRVKTIEMVKDFVHSEFMRTPVELKSPHDFLACEFMGIPQGESEEAIVQCALSIAKLVCVTWWGIPRWMANSFGTRQRVIEKMQVAFAGRDIDHKYHLLGMSENLDDDIKCVHLPGVVGIDSANPIVMALNGFNMERDKYIHLPRHTKDFDYWECVIVSDDVRDNVKYIRKLLEPKP